jgi:endonuclease/exonuclease/phosphatase family metal-dependent hydrolase
VDFDGDPRQTRRAPFEQLYQIVKPHVNEPLIVMGDFNTPIDSVFFEKLRGQLQGAFETAGSGNAATWPMVAPIMSLDHVWLSKHFRVVRCEHRTSIYSDHRAVVVDLAWK